MSTVDQTDRQIIAATQDGLPLSTDPYGDVGGSIGLPGEEVRARIAQMVANGVIRRMGVVPNHYALGMKANGMSVWDVEDDLVRDLGTQIGSLDFVSHCYCRPRHLPVWPYNLFAMAHGQDRAEVEVKVGEIAALLGSASRGHDVLFSSRILKKTGLRIAAPTPEDTRCSA